MAAVRGWDGWMRDERVLAWYAGVSVTSFIFHIENDSLLHSHEFRISKACCVNEDCNGLYI